MHTERQISQLLAQRAAEWMEALKGGKRQDHAAFDAWLRDSKLHVEYYLEMEALDRQIQELPAADRPDIDGILASAPKVRMLERSNFTREGKTSPWQRAWPIAAAIAGLAIALLAYRTLTSPANRYTTAIGEQRTLRLSDGSQIRMNVDTALEVDYRANQRDVELLSGEAVFDVEQDASRPFIVRTPNANVRVLGTEFNVYHRKATVVSVLEGRVQVTPLREEASGSSQPQTAIESLDAGEEVQVTQGRIKKRTHADVAKTAAWREGRLYFEGTPLEEIVREFNRHGGPIELKVEGITPGSYRFDGTFNANDPASLADILEQQADLVVERRQGEILIRARNSEG